MVWWLQTWAWRVRGVHTACARRVCTACAHGARGVCIVWCGRADLVEGRVAVLVVVVGAPLEYLVEARVG